MISFLQSKLGSVAGFVIGYVPNLIISPLLLVLSALFQPWVWLDLTWGVVGTGLGFVAGIIMILMGGETVPQWGKYARVRAPGYLDSWGGAFSMGPIMVGWSGFSQWAHEYGHTWQNRLLGPLYLLIIAIPSLISATFTTSHNSFFTETWADSWSSWP